MSTFKTFILALALALLGLAPAAHATVVTFEDLSGSGALPSNYAGLNWGNWRYYDGTQTPYQANSGAQRIYSFDEVATFGFASAVVFDGAYFSGLDPVFFNLYYQGNLVGTSSLDLGSGTGPTFLGSGYAGLVDQVEVFGWTQHFVMDDVTFHAQDEQSVPEPGSVALMGVALAGLAVWQRRRKVA